MKQLELQAKLCNFLFKAYRSGVSLIFAVLEVNMSFFSKMEALITMMKT